MRRHPSETWGLKVRGALGIPTGIRLATTRDGENLTIGATGEPYEEGKLGGDWRSSKLGSRWTGSGIAEIVQIDIELEYKKKSINKKSRGSTYRKKQLKYADHTKSSPFWRRCRSDGGVPWMARGNNGGRNSNQRSNSAVAIGGHSFCGMAAVGDRV
ncbi:hypothetical protein Ddye_016345 [Dipteronia dyeriana]|uniref:Uncharacterized protein n=1 Tax=Dipteronia dyeriana TaxID=168575 RepID=A0AAD9WZH0_9ROSI|nr:hypothetical protein Ddye_016345 [Dipteronia dyeriana]